MCVITIIVELIISSLMKRELNKAVALKGIQLVTISSPAAFGEYSPYHFIDTEQEFLTVVKMMHS